MGIGGGHPYGVFIFEGDGVDGGAIAVQGGARVVSRPEDGEDHVVGGQETAVVEGHAPAQAEQPGQGVGVLPTHGQQGHQFHVGVESGQSLEYIGLQKKGDILGASVGY